MPPFVPTFRTGHSALRICRPAALLAVLLFAAGLTWQAGRRGFFPFDQSIVFDGAYRILHGQVPYQDFVIPVGPVTFWIQAAVFWIGGVSYGSYLAHSMLGNVLATLAVYVTLRRLYPQTRSWAYVGAILTAIWFYPPFGTPWEEQTGFLLTLLGLMIAACSLSISSTRAVCGLACGCGVAVGLAFLSKQNAGLFGGALVASTLACVHRSTLRRLGMAGLGFAVGVSVVAIAFAAWLYVASDPAIFWRYFWVIPAEEGHRRLFGNWLRTGEIALLGDGPPRCRLAVGIACLTAMVALWHDRVHWRGTSSAHQTGLTAACLVLAATLAQNLFIASANNNPENGYSLLGLVLAIWGGSTCALLGRATSSRWLPLKPLFLVLYGGLLALVAAEGLQVGLRRDVHDLFLDSHFSGHCDVPILRDVVWTQAEPLPCSELEDIVRFLERRRSPFVVLHDFSLLHAMLGQPSPQPLLTFHEGLTYARGGDPLLDRWIVKSLATRHISVVVVQAHDADDPAVLLPQFPMVRDFLVKNYVPTARIGPFQIFEREEPPR